MERNEAIDVVKRNYPHVTESGSQFETALRILIPELKESEDERIKKELIDLVRARLVGFPQSEKYIAWLEKQGEQKSVDKVEPKFKVGDWVIYKDNVWKICNISLKTYYELLKINNEVSTRHIEDVDKTARLWTIQDAKDGDVLVTEFGKPFIFKDCSDTKHPNTPVAYCGINDANDFIISVGRWWASCKVYPATKEQRETLLKAMTDAGHTFDFEKKELKKIEQNPAWSEEVDLEKEIDKWYNNEASKEFENVLYEDIEKCAEHFFELGLKAQKGE